MGKKKKTVSKPKCVKREVVTEDGTVIQQVIMPDGSCRTLIDKGVKEFLGGVAGFDKNQMASDD